MDWEIYSTPAGYRAELFRGGDPKLLATVAGRNKPWLYARMAVKSCWAKLRNA